MKVFARVAENRDASGGAPRRNFHLQCVYRSFRGRRSAQGWERFTLMVYVA